MRSAGTHEAICPNLTHVPVCASGQDIWSRALSRSLNTPLFVRYCCEEPNCVSPSHRDGPRHVMAVALEDLRSRRPRVRIALQGESASRLAASNASKVDTTLSDLIRRIDGGLLLHSLCLDYTNPWSDWLCRDASPLCFAATLRRHASPPCFACTGVSGAKHNERMQTTQFRVADRRR